MTSRIECVRTRRVLACLLVAAAITALFPARAASSTLTELAADERARVLAGQLVVRKRVTWAGERELFGGDAWLRVEAPVERVWQLVVRPELYRYVLPHAIESWPERGGVRLVHAIGPSRIEYRLAIERDDGQRKLRFAVAPEGGSTVRAGRAALRITPLGNTSSLLAWSILADADLGVLRALLRPAVQDAMLRVPLRIRALLVSHRLGARRAPRS